MYGIICIRSDNLIFALIVYAARCKNVLMIDLYLELIFECVFDAVYE